MLKRQRPSSPSPISPETIVDDVDSDLYQPDSKRLKYFGSSSSYGQGSHNEAVVNDSESEVEDGREEYFQGRREWQTQAGTYKDANILLHDLHAEQRHRMLFNISHLPPTTQQTPPNHAATYANESKDVAQFDTTQRLDHQGPSNATSGLQPDVQDEPGRCEAQRVSQCYEWTNRCGRSQELLP